MSRRKGDEARVRGVGDVVVPESLLVREGTGDRVALGVRGSLRVRGGLGVRGILVVREGAGVPGGTGLRGPAGPRAGRGGPARQPAASGGGGGAGAGRRLAMDPDRLRRLAERAPVPFRALEPLAPMTSFRSGGPAALYAEPEDAAGLAAALAYAEGEGLPALILGGGTNLIFDDLGFEGLVARPGGRFRELAPPAGAGGAGGPSAGAPSVWAGAAARLSDVVGYARSQGRSGWARLAGVPGTLGGALVMNAGAHGVETGDLVVAAQVLEGGRPACVPRGECGFAYRRSALEVRGPVLGAELLLGDPAPEEEILRLEREALGARAARLPRRPSAGSVFRNPPGDSAGRLIEACGLKGARFGGAEISREHANVIVNAGGASSSEFRALAGLARLEVMRREGVLLEPEVRMLGRLGEVCP